MFAGVFLPVGELLRRLAARWVPLVRDLGWIERVLVDLYLGGGGLYVLAALPVGLFSLPLVVAYLGGGAIVLAILVARSHWSGARTGLPLSAGSVSAWLPAALVLVATLALFAIEVAVAEGVPAGNSFDTSLLADYVALLLLHHQVPVSLAPIAPQLTSYPQGTTVWMAVAQLIYSLPPARTPLLVTPLFLSLPPLAGYVFGKRQLGSPWAGAAVGLTFALIGSWTRVMVATSNDFAVSFPLVLWLLARIDVWRNPKPPVWSDAIAYGAILGYSAALNPVGAEWLLLVVVALGLVRGRARLDYLRGAIPRWILTVVVAVLFVTPTLWTFLQGRGTLFAPSGTVAVPVPTQMPGITSAQFIGSIDPFIFGPTGIWLSPFTALRFELALLLVAGAAVLVIPALVPRFRKVGRSFRPLVLATIASALVLLLVELGAGSGVRALDTLAALSSAPEISIELFTVYTILAALPIYLLLQPTVEPEPSARPFSGGPSPTTSRFPSARPRTLSGSTAVVLALAVVLIVPGVVVTATDFPSYLDQLYGSYGRVTAADFAMLEWARHGLPTGSRVLVAPGSAAQFLPGYANVAIVFPVQRIASNASYVDLDRQLVEGRLNATGFLEIQWLDVQYVAVTGNTTNLWAPFSAAPLLADPEFHVIFQQGDAYVFEL